MKRFYKNVSVAETDLGWTIALDGRPVKTQGGQPQALPTERLAQMLASEWDQQGETIDPASFRFRDMTDYAIDVVARDPAALVDKLLGYAETDTLCYRADPEDPLFHRQQELWEPIVAGVETRENMKLHRVSGILHRPQTKRRWPPCAPGCRRSIPSRWPRWSRRQASPPRCASGWKRCNRTPTARHCGPRPIWKRTGKPTSGAATRKRKDAARNARAIFSRRWSL